MIRQRGFTLIELAIVLVIVTILIGGLAVPLTAQIQARRIAETRQILDEAREAILGYAMTHAATPAERRHLPCPDTDNPPDGRENRAGDACTQSSGLLPWVDLGTASQDAWGNRVRYAVVAQTAHRGVGFGQGIALADPLGVCTTNACPPLAPDIAADVAFVVVSHGANGWGGRNISGSSLAVPTGPDEVDNLDNDRIYVSRSPTPVDAAAGEFDDLARWMPYGELIARVCPPGSDCDGL
jgi:prepilin-type N-terminal cleavage/methylation domain-containing protein